MAELIQINSFTTAELAQSIEVYHLVGDHASFSHNMTVERMLQRILGDARQANDMNVFIDGFNGLRDLLNKKIAHFDVTTDNINLRLMIRDATPAPHPGESHAMPGGNVTPPSRSIPLVELVGEFVFSATGGRTLVFDSFKDRHERWNYTGPETRDSFAEAFDCDEGDAEERASLDADFDKIIAAGGALVEITQGPPGVVFAYRKHEHEFKADMVGVDVASGTAKKFVHRCACGLEDNP